MALQVLLIDDEPELRLSLAEALRDARASLPGDALHQATGWAFTAFGAA